MCLFQVLVPLGTTVAMEMRFSRHAPSGVWVCCWGAQEVFPKSPGSSHSPSDPVLPVLLLLCSHAVLQLWPYGVHMEQRSHKYPVLWGENAQMPEIPRGLVPHLGPHMHEQDSPASTSLSGTESGITTWTTSWHQSMLRIPVLPVEQQSLREQAVAELLPAFQPRLLDCGIFQGRRAAVILAREKQSRRNKEKFLQLTGWLWNQHKKPGC